jgi:enoyl-CoA hydratase
MTRPAASYETLLLNKEDGVDWLTLNRPASLNAANVTMLHELRDYFHGVTSDNKVRIILLRGAGRAFCAGVDLKGHAPGETTDVRGVTPVEGLRRQRTVSEMIVMMRRCPQPIVALVHGAACGLGFALALAADIRIAGESAKMNAAFIKVGLSGADVGVAYLLPRLVGLSLASELMLTGRFIHGPRAEQLGLVSRCVPDAELETAGREIVKEMLATAPLALRLTKDALNVTVDAGSLESAIAIEDRNQVLCTMSSDHAEAVLAFVEKRPPVYGDQ